MALFARTTTLSANFPGTYEQVYLAAFAAVYALGYTPDMADPNMRMICYSTPTTAFTWGVNVTIGLVPQQGQVVVEITAQSLWPMPTLGQEGRNKKIINAAFEQINAAPPQGAPPPGRLPSPGRSSSLTCYSRAWRSRSSHCCPPWWSGEPPRPASSSPPTPWRW